MNTLPEPDRPGDPWTLAVVIPCKDETDAADPLFADLARLPSILGPHAIAHQIICVDDGSSDGTAQALEAASQRHRIPFVLLTHPHNQGLGAALRTAAAATASSRLVITWDADRPYPLDDLPALIAPLAAGTADVVTASPWHPEGHATIPWFRRALSRSASRIHRRRLGPKGEGVHTITCGYRAWTRGAFVACLPQANGFAATAEMLLNALAQNLRVQEVPSRLQRRTDGQSKMRILPALWGHMKLLAKRR